MKKKLNTFDVLSYKKNRFYFVSFISLLVIVAATLAFHSWTSKKMFLQKALETSSQSAELAAMDSDNLLNDMDLVNRDVINTILERNSKKGHVWTREEWDSLCAERIKYIKELDGLKIFDEYGAYLGTENGKHPNATVADRYYFQESKNNPQAGAVLSPPVKSKSSGNWVFILARRYNKPNGDFGGVVITNLPIKYLMDFYGKMPIGKRGVVSVIREKDSIVFAQYPWDENVLGKTTDKDLIEALRSAKADTGHFSLLNKEQNKKMLYSFDRKVQQGLTLVFGIDESEYMGGWKKEALWILGVILILYPLFILLFLKFLGNQIREQKLIQQQMEAQEKVSDLVKNIKQAVFTVDKNGLIMTPVSDFSESIFDGSIIGHNVFDRLYTSIPKESEQYSAIRTAFAAVFRSDEVQWVLMEYVFPKKLKVQIGNKDKVLKISTNPIWDMNRNVERLMFTVEDVTELDNMTRKVELEKARSNRNLAIFQELIAVPVTDLNDYFKNTEKLFSETKDILVQSIINAENLSAIFRNLHTIKGNSRAFNLNYLSGTTHKIESDFMKIREQQNTENLKESLIDFNQGSMGILEDQIKEYRAIAARIYSNNNAGAVPTEVRAQLNSARNLLKDEAKKMDPEVYRVLADIFSNILNDSSFAILKKYIISTIVSTSTYTGKQIKYDVVGFDFILDDSILETLKDTIMHLVRNAVDHGIESAELRQKLGKSFLGNVSVIFEVANEELKIQVIDDGEGISIEKIKEKAIGMRIVSEEQAENMKASEIMQFIFRSGFSTKDEVTETSGRGVGLDVVKNNVERCKGTIHIDSVEGRGTIFVMKFPVAGRIQYVMKNSDL